VSITVRHTVWSMNVTLLLPLFVPYKVQYSDIHSYNTIHKHDLYVQFCNTDHCKRSVINMGTKIFNGLPLEFKSVENFNVFKRKLKNYVYLLCSAFYSLQEFFN
jgi:hypothetical protein